MNCTVGSYQEARSGIGDISEWALFRANVAFADLSNVTRIVLCIGSINVDSDVVGPTVLWWNESVTDKPKPDGSDYPDGSATYTGDVIRAKLGMVSPPITPNTYTSSVMILYDSANPDGYTVSDDEDITIHPGCVTS